MSTPDSHAEFFESVQSRTHDLLDQLMVENHALRDFVESLKGEMSNVERAYETGVNDYVTKPINALELLTKLNNVLSH